MGEQCNYSSYFACVWCTEWIPWTVLSINAGCVHSMSQDKINQRKTNNAVFVNRRKIISLYVVIPKPIMLIQWQ